MTQKVFIGVDDTDILGGPFGTGRVARDMAARLEQAGKGRTIGVIRYQLLVDPRISYTSHNSAKCIEFEAEAPLAEIHTHCIDFLKNIFLAGSDPGVCTCAEVQVTQELIAYGERAQKEVLDKASAVRLAQKTGILLTEVGGTGEGIIGAVAAAGLRGSGSGGRYVQLRGIRNISGLAVVKSILSETAITAVVGEDGRPVDGEEIIDSQDWIKPNVAGGKPVLRVRLRFNQKGTRVWETIEQKHKKEHQGKEAVL
jgi:hypothetical protein